MKNTLTVSDLSLHLGEYLRRVSEHHERFIIVEDGEQIAEIKPASPEVAEEFESTELKMKTP